MQRFYYLFSACSLSFMPMAVAQHSVGPQVTKDRVATANELIDRLGGLPAEYKADLGLAILAREDKSVTADREEQVSRAIFESAPRARYPSNLIYAAKSPDSSQSQVAHNLYTEPLDTLDIQVRIVDRNLKDHLNFALSSFEAIRLSTERASCENAAVSDVSAYYRTALKLLIDSRVTQIGGYSKHNYVAQLAQASAEPERIVPFMALLAQLPTEMYDTNEIALLLTKYFGENTANDREMNALGITMLGSVTKLQARWSTAQQPLRPFFDKVRLYLVKSLSAEACGDVTSNRKTLTSRFNVILTEPSLHDVAPIAPEEVLPHTHGVGATDPQIPLDPVVLGHLQHLIAAQQSRMASAAKPGSVADVVPTSEDVDAILKAGLEPTDTASRCPLCDFESRAVNFYMLVSSLPSGQDRQKALVSEVSFLNFNNVEEKDAPAYLSVLKALINVSRPVDAQTQEQLGSLAKTMKFITDGPSDEAPLIRSELQRSTDRVIQAYVSFERLYHPAYILPAPLAARLAAAHKP